MVVGLSSVTLVRGVVLDSTYVMPLARRARVRRILNIKARIHISNPFPRLASFYDQELFPRGRSLTTRMHSLHSSFIPRLSRRYARLQLFRLHCSHTPYLVHYTTISGMRRGRVAITRIKVGGVGKRRKEEEKIFLRDATSPDWQVIFLGTRGV